MISVTQALSKAIMLHDLLNFVQLSVCRYGKDILNQCTYICLPLSLGINNIKILITLALMMMND